MALQTSIRISGPGVLGDKQGGFSLGWTVAQGVLICLLMGAVPKPAWVMVDGGASCE